MMRTDHWSLRYGIAVAAVAAAVALILVPAIGKGGASIPFFAVLVSAWYGGLGPGLFATALTVTIYLSVVAHRGSDFPPWLALQVVLFVAGGVVITSLVEALHSARRRAEANQRWLSAVLTSIGDAVIATDGRGLVTFTNPVARSLTGWGQDEAAGRPLDEVFSIISEGDRRPAENPVSRVIRDGVTVGLTNHTLLIARDGTERPIADSAAPIKDDASEVIGVVLVFRDVAEERRHEQERERLVEVLRENDRLKDEFLAMLAHELRNPLAAMGSAVALTARGGQQEHIDWAMEVISRQIRHLTRLIDDLLDVSRITRGKIGLRRERADAAAVVVHALEAVRALADERKHEVTVELPEGGLWLDADPTRLEQVVVNLLNNAAKYTESGGRIRVAGWREGGDVVLSVRDDGVGISPELLPRVFDLFTQADRSLARSEGGLGVGLTVVKAIVEMHGGSVTAVSEGPGHGSDFVVRLPGAEGPALTAPEPRQPPAGPRRGRARILVVDDNADMARALSRFLRRLGHEVRTAASGTEGIEIARAYAPQVVLLDIGLPGMDGYEVARKLRGEECGRDAVIIAVSGYGRDEDRRLAKEAGFNHHLVKPVDHDTLVTLISRP